METSNLEKVVIYLEKLGYTVEEQGKIQKYLIVFRAGLPIGFILMDMTVKLVADADEQQEQCLKNVIAFVNENKDLMGVGNSEYLLVDYKGNRLTTFYDINSMSAQFVSYVHSDSTGEVVSTAFSNYDTAIYNFVAATKMMNLDALKAAKHDTFGDRMRTRLINYLINKSKEKAEQH